MIMLMLISLPLSGPSVGVVYAQLIPLSHLLYDSISQPCPIRIGSAWIKRFLIPKIQKQHVTPTLAPISANVAGCSACGLSLSQQIQDGRIPILIALVNCCAKTRQTIVVLAHWRLSTCNHPWAGRSTARENLCCKGKKGGGQPTLEAPEEESCGCRLAHPLPGNTTLTRPCCVDSGGSSGCARASSGNTGKPRGVICIKAGLGG